MMMSVADSDRLVGLTETTEHPMRDVQAGRSVTDPMVQRHLAFAAHGVHRRGGMERAACEVLERMANGLGWRVSVIGRTSEVQGGGFKAVRTLHRPALIGGKLFRRKAQATLAGTGADVTASIGAAAGPVDVVVTQFCHAAFTARFGGLRGGKGLRGVWQRFSQRCYASEERAVYQHPRLKRVIAVSRGVGREVVEHYGVDPEIIRVIPNAVDHATFHPADTAEKAPLRDALGLPGDAVLASFVGGDWRRKGLADVVAAMAEVEDVELVVVGPGDIPAWREVCREHGVGDRVHFAGRTREPQNYMRASDFYVFPSRYEAFSLSCIEAAACGLPLVTTKINGSEELVEDGVNGFFVTFEAQSLIEPMRRLRDDVALRQRMSDAAAKSAERYDWDTIAAEHAKVYAEAAGL